jgi:hypothetical protein
MIPSVRRVACAEATFVLAIGPLVGCSYLCGSGPTVNFLFNAHAGGGYGLLAIWVAVIIASLVLLFNFPIAAAKLLDHPTERTPTQVAVVLLGLLFFLSILIVIFVAVASK